MQDPWRVSDSVSDTARMIKRPFLVLVRFFKELVCAAEAPCLSGTFCLSGRILPINLVAINQLNFALKPVRGGSSPLCERVRARLIGSRFQIKQPDDLNGLWEVVKVASSRRKNLQTHTHRKVSVEDRAISWPVE